MSISQETRQFVRQRAGFRCEYCGITERGTGAELTLDHYFPKVRGGSDDLSNLVYCCFRCNQYKSDYWPSQPGDIRLFNPREDSAEAHFFVSADGTLRSGTTIGNFTILQVRLNRIQLIQGRIEMEIQDLRRKEFEMTAMLSAAQDQTAGHTDEQERLLEFQRLLSLELFRST